MKEPVSDIVQKAFKLAQKARENAYADYSKVKVGGGNEGQGLRRVVLWRKCRSRC